MLRGDSWEATRRAGHGTVTAAYFYPIDGFAYRDGNGKLTGVLIEMMDQLRSYLANVQGTDVTVRFRPLRGLRPLL